MDILDQWASSTKAGDASGYTKHPLGDFPAVITGVKAKVMEKTQTPIWNITAKSQHGSAQYTIWGFSQADMNKAGTHQDSKDQIISAIGRYKRLYIELGVWSEDEAQNASWSNGPHSLLACMNQLMGKACNLHVETSSKDPNRQVVYLNKPEANQQAVNQNAAATSGMNNLPPNDQYSTQQPMNNMAPPFPDDQAAPSHVAPPSGY